MHGSRGNLERGGRGPPLVMPDPSQGSVGTLLDLMEEFRDGTRGVTSSTIADEQGLVVASDDTGPRSQALAATGVLLRRTANSAFTSLALEEPDSLVVEGGRSRAYVSRIGNTRFTLVVLMEEDFDFEAVAARAEDLEGHLSEVLQHFA